MKKIIAVVVAVLVAVSFVAFSGKDKNDFIRIHIRANSNTEIDQEVKYTVKNAVVTALAPLVREVDSKEAMYEFLQENLDAIKKIADKSLSENSFNYTANVRLDSEFFPARSYGNITLDEGIYDALIVELGEGEGNNWWCIVYPQFCFVEAEKSNSQNFEYKSKIKELYEKLSNK